MYNLVDFGQEIKTIRKSLKINQAEVALKTGIQRDTLRRLENGQSVPKIETLDRLSFLYGKDLYIIFSNYRLTIDNYISKRIHYISKDFRNFNYDKIPNEITLFKNAFKDSSYYGAEYFSKKNDQFTSYLESLANLNSSIKDRSRQHLSKLFESLQIHKSKLKLQAYRLDKLEIRILILLGTLYRIKDELHTTALFFDTALEAVTTKYKDDPEFLYFYLLIQLNRMTYYHRISRFEMVKEIYDASIKILDEKIGMNNLFVFLVRSGINKHRLKEPHLDGMVQTALQLIKDSGDVPKYNVELKVLKEKFPFLKLDLIQYEDE